MSWRGCRPCQTRANRMVHPFTSASSGAARVAPAQASAWPRPLSSVPHVALHAALTTRQLRTALHATQSSLFVLI